MALKLKFDLSSVLEEGFDEDQRRALTPAINQDSIKREFAQQCIDRILERTNRGIDKNGDSFPGYSKAYKNSRAFEVYGKDSTVNLKLSGAMQASIGILSTGTRSVTIAIDGGLEEDKARGHINGANYLPVRDFWGLPMDDQVEILKGILREENAQETFELLQEFTSGISAQAILAGTAGTQTVELSASALALLAELEDL